MKRINPIYILALIVTFFILSFSLLSDKKDEYQELNKQFLSLNEKAKNFKEYNQNWFNEKRVQKKIDTIVKSSSFRKEKILKTQNKNSVRVKIESDNPKVLNKFLNRVLNEKFRFKKLEIQKRTISLEIGLR